jgi:hypothetical protein
MAVVERRLTRDGLDSVDRRGKLLAKVSHCFNIAPRWSVSSTARSEAGRLRGERV